MLPSAVIWGSTAKTGDDHSRRHVPNCVVCPLVLLAAIDRQLRTAKK